MTPTELEAYDAMMASRDTWRDKACDEQHKADVLERENARLQKRIGDCLALVARCKLEMEDSNCIGAFEAIEGIEHILSNKK